MAEPFKNLINAAGIELIIESVEGDGFDAERFRSEAVEGLVDLELKARVQHVADALARALPQPYPRALQSLLARLPDPPTGTDGLTSQMWRWPITDFVGRYGLEHPVLSLEALKRLTPFSTGEFAIRPYFAADPEGTMATLAEWALDENVHVRRLVSEGSRPRLPWGIKLQHRIDHPGAMLSTLERLRDDPDEYVRRSVANHINDIAKDSPDWVIEVCGAWMQGADRHRKRLVKHALRTLVKRCDPRAYGILGLAPLQGTASTTCSTERLVVGESVDLTAVLQSTGSAEQRVRLDYAMHFRKADGSLSPKVFHWTERTLGPGERLEITKSHTVKVVTTRRLRAGEQGIELRVNGLPVELHRFELLNER